MTPNRSIAHAVLAATIALVAIGSSATASAAAGGLGNWAMYGDGPAHNSVNRDETTLSTNTASRLHITHTYSKWHAMFPPYQIIVGSMGYAVIAVPSAYGDVGEIAAFHLPSGAQAWRHQGISRANNDWNYVPAVSNGVLFVGGDSGMYAFDALTGRPLWTTVLNASLSLFNEVTVSGDTVYATDYAATRVYAFSATTGHILWSAAPSGCCIIGPVTVVNGLAYVVTDHLVAYNAATGAPAFSGNSAVSGETVAVSGGVAYVQGVDNLYAFSAGTGAPLWIAPIQSTNYYSTLTPAVDGNTVVVGTAQYLIAYSAKTGARLWTIDSGSSSNDYAPPAIANGVVYAGSIGSGLQAIDESTGHVLYTGGVNCWAATVSHGAVYDSCSGGMTVFGL